MSVPVTYEVAEQIVTITLDDGKANALSPVLQGQISGALDAAEKDATRAVVIAGNEKLFCGGFDLSVFKAGDSSETVKMLTGGFNLAVRILTFPKPVVIAATGPAIAMGSFLLLCGDHRIGSARSRCQANEVAIGMALPTSAIEIMRMRLTPAVFQSAATMARPFVGDPAVAAGWLDEVVEPENVLARAKDVAVEAASNLDLHAHLTTKLRARTAAVSAITAGIAELAADFG
ncbi:crotonase/enoyl-CoA hydratase family protein [Mycolicibacterium septicum]|uniref:crotonase/enoyl-CoA hydratase family protein n=1 Tax=Mycolicibacterium septicum TaxID=98668 RepID=UPI00235E39F7|nr:crotonase/enoyl-CoA hydratase family protein [Mycolicibacterium septicum]